MSIIKQATPTELFNWLLNERGIPRKTESDEYYKRQHSARNEANEIKERKLIKNGEL